MKRLLSLSCSLIALILFSANAAESGSYQTSFDKVAPYANMDTLANRMLHGLSYRQLKTDSIENGIDLSKFSIDPRNEKWSVHVPSSASANGRYGLLIWMPHSKDFTPPESWVSELEERHIVLVAPLNATKDRDLVFERAALGLLGLSGIIADYAIDPTRIYVGGNGDGALVAEALALSYGDVFSGAFLAGPVAVPGSDTLPVPAPGVIEQVAKRSRFVFLGHSEPGSSDIHEFATAMKNRVCVSEVTSARRPPKAERPTAAQFRNALADIDHPVTRDVTACIKNRENDAKLALEEIRQLVDRESPKTAIKELIASHEEYGAMIDQEIFMLSDKLKEKFRDAYLEYAESVYNPDERLNLVREQNAVQQNRNYTRSGGPSE